MTHCCFSSVTFDLFGGLECVHTDLQAPHTGGVVQGGVQLSRPAGVSEVSDVPHINTVVVVDARQPAVGRVVGHRHRVRVTSLRLAGEQLTEEEQRELREELF